MTAKKLLFIRSVPMPYALAALQAIRLRNKGAQLAVLTGPASATPIEAAQTADIVIPYLPPRFGPWFAGYSLLRRLRRERLDRVIVPYVGESRRPFGNVGRMALLAGGKKTVWHACDLPEAAEERDDVRVRWSECWHPVFLLPRIQRFILELKYRSRCVGYGLIMLLFGTLAAICVQDARRWPGRRTRVHSE